MSVFFPRLDLEATQKLYEAFVQRAKAEQQKANSYLFEIKKREIVRFGKHHFRQMEKEGLNTWNGRYVTRPVTILCKATTPTPCQSALVLTGEKKANPKRIPSRHLSSRIRELAGKRPENRRVRLIPVRNRRGKLERV